jgi:hypothetical protein
LKERAERPQVQGSRLGDRLGIVTYPPIFNISGGLQPIDLSQLGCIVDSGLTKTPATCLMLHLSHSHPPLTGTVTESRFVFVQTVKVAFRYGGVLNSLRATVFGDAGRTWVL